MVELMSDRLSYNTFHLAFGYIERKFVDEQEIRGRLAILESDIVWIEPRQLHCT